MARGQSKTGGRLARGRRSRIVPGWTYADADTHAYNARSKFSGSDPWKCGAVGCTYVHKDKKRFPNFKQHVRSHVKLSNEEKVRLGLVCDYGECRETFHTRNMLKRHAERKHYHGEAAGESLFSRPQASVSPDIPNHGELSGLPGPLPPSTLPMPFVAIPPPPPPPPPPPVSDNIQSLNELLYELSVSAPPPAPHTLYMEATHTLPPCTFPNDHLDAYTTDPPAAFSSMFNTIDGHHLGLCSTSYPWTGTNTQVDPITYDYYPPFPPFVQHEQHAPPEERTPNGITISFPTLSDFINYMIRISMGN